MPNRVTLLTDFGTADGYVGAMKGVIAALAPEALIDDVSHDIGAGDIEAAAWALGAYWRRYPAGTVHVVVVDPGVGTARRAIALEADGRALVGPDNGVLGLALRDAQQIGRAHAIDALAGAAVSPTFHGRDLFAPAAARLATGEPIEAVGPPVDDLVRLPWPDPASDERGVDGVVVHVDRFGNLVTNLPAAACARSDAHVLVMAGAAGTPADVGPVRRTYGDVGSGGALALIGSRGLLEISVRDGSAADRFGGKGTAVRLEASGR